MIKVKMWMNHRILHVTAGSEENLQEQLLKFQTCKVFLCNMNVVRLDQTVLSWVAFMRHPFTCALVCPSHLFFL